MRLENAKEERGYIQFRMLQLYCGCGVTREREQTGLLASELIAHYHPQDSHSSSRDCWTLGGENKKSVNVELTTVELLTLYTLQETAKRSRNHVLKYNT